MPLPYVGGSAEAVGKRDAKETTSLSADRIQSSD